MTAPATVGKPPAHLRLTLSGVFGTALAPYESFTMRVNVLPTFTNLQTGLAQAGVNALPGLAGIMKNEARFTEVKAAAIGPNGLYSGDPVVTLVDVPGTRVDGVAIAQVSVVASLLTARRGASGRGRIYIPMPGFNVSATGGVYALGSVENMRAGVVAFLDNINAFGGGPRVCIASSKGYLSVITGVKVGRVPDTIRSRRTSIPEAYSGIAALA